MVLTWEWFLPWSGSLQLAAMAFHRDLKGLMNINEGGVNMTPQHIRGWLKIAL